MKPKELVSYIIDYLNNNINRFVSIDEIANFFGYDKTYIMKLFKKHIGISIKDYQNRKRILNCIKDMYRGDLLLKVALNNGFNSLEYFSETFTKIVGVSPSNYKKFIFGREPLDDLSVIEDFISSNNELNIRLSMYRVENNKVLRLKMTK